MKNKLNLLRFVIIFLALPFSIISCENKSDVINERESLVLGLRHPLPLSVLRAGCLVQ